MKYTKQPLSIEQQITKLKQRGLLINNENSAKNYLSNISYYRLRAYTFPFQDNNNSENNHHFLKSNINFEDIIDLYCFDRRLRSLIFNALEKIEVALRTKFIYEYSIETGSSQWFEDRTLYFKQDKFGLIMEKIVEDVERSDEDFISHYKQKYTSPELPPAWMTLETLSFGNLSKMIANLDAKSIPYKRIADFFGLSNPFILGNWIYSFSVLRNYCAHHSRIWNRRFHVELKLPYNTVYSFIDRQILSTVHSNKLFAVLSSIQYVIKIISPESDFKNNLLTIINEGGKLLNLRDMDFPENWQSLGVWE
jgi:abortive infection bacteriophage resistance protein